MAKKTTMNADEYEERINKKGSKYILKLYVTGTTPRSMRAIENLKQIAADYFDDYELDIIDIYKKPQLGKDEQIIAAPTLLKKLPLPLRKFVGDLSNKDQILLGLDLKKKKTNEEKK